MSDSARLHLVKNVAPANSNVTRVALAELTDIYDARAPLEEQAARAAGPRLTPHDIEVIEATARAIDARGSSASSDQAIADLRRRIHFTIYRAAGRPHLLGIIERLWELSARFEPAHQVARRLRTNDALFAIRSIVTACQRKDGHGLGLLVRMQVRQAEALAMDTLSRSPKASRRPATRPSPQRARHELV